MKCLPEQSHKGKCVVREDRHGLYVFFEHYVFRSAFPSSHRSDVGNGSFNPMNDEVVTIEIYAGSKFCRLISEDGQERVWFCHGAYGCVEEVMNGHSEDKWKPDSEVWLDCINVDPFSVTKTVMVPVQKDEHSLFVLVGHLLFRPVFPVSFGVIEKPNYLKPKEGDSVKLLEIGSESCVMTDNKTATVWYCHGVFLGDGCDQGHTKKPWKPEGEDWRNCKTID